jgi:hypothetical protein
MISGTNLLTIMLMLDMLGILKARVQQSYLDPLSI